MASIGIEGDRHCIGIEKGEFSQIKAPHRQVTLFEREVFDTIRATTTSLWLLTNVE